ncbi:hypothetical protein M885DRAFT_541387 [Pelagophyceae sp. CCMP2097]|nr:hypothetical protein M885DRAFT_541387 [Pelagophyceae sp. CCMP2097]
MRRLAEGSYLRRHGFDALAGRAVPQDAPRVLIWLCGTVGGAGGLGAAALVLAAELCLVLAAAAYVRRAPRRLHAVLLAGATGGSLQSLAHALLLATALLAESGRDVFSGAVGAAAVYVDGCAPTTVALIVFVLVVNALEGGSTAAAHGGSLARRGAALAVAAVALAGVDGLFGGAACGAVLCDGAACDAPAARASLAAALLRRITATHAGGEPSLGPGWYVHMVMFDGFVGYFAAVLGFHAVVYFLPVAAARLLQGDQDDSDGPRRRLEPLAAAEARGATHPLRRRALDPVLVSVASLFRGAPSLVDAVVADIVAADVVQSDIVQDDAPTSAEKVPTAWRRVAAEDAAAAAADGRRIAALLAIGVSLCVLPAAKRAWLETGSGNANHVFFQTFVFTAARAVLALAPP